MSKSVEGSENNTDSNDEDDNGSIGLNYRDGSDNGSGTQVLPNFGFHPLLNYVFLPLFV